MTASNPLRLKHRQSWRNAVTTSLVTSFFSAVAHAAAPTIHSVQLAGSGCPANSDSRATYDEVSGRLRMVPSAQEAKAGEGVRVGRSSCNLVASVQVPAGFKLVASLPAFWGPASLVEGTTGKASLEVFFNEAAAGAPVKAETQLQSDKEWMYAIQRERTETVCKTEDTSVLLRMNSSVFLMSAQTAAASQAQVKRAGVSLQLAECNVESL